MRAHADAVKEAVLWPVDSDRRALGPITERDIGFRW